MDPMKPMRENALDLQKRYGGVLPQETEDLAPWETAFLDWWRFMHAREMLVALRSESGAARDKKEAS